MTATDEQAGSKPDITYWHLWCDADGVSHQSQCSLNQFELNGVGNAAPQWTKPIRKDASMWQPHTCPGKTQAAGVGFRGRHNTSPADAAGDETPGYFPDAALAV
jgi:hypothetical protein